MIKARDVKANVEFCVNFISNMQINNFRSH